MGNWELAQFGNRKAIFVCEVLIYVKIPHLWVYPQFVTYVRQHSSGHDGCSICSSIFLRVGSVHYFCRSNEYFSTVRSQVPLFKFLYASRTKVLSFTELIGYQVMLNWNLYKVKASWNRTFLAF